MTISERFADHAAGTRFEDLPAEVVDAVKSFILATIGVGIAGSATPESRSLLEVARGWGAGEEAKVWGKGSGLPAGSAAMVNAHCVHCLEFDPIHEPAVVHAMTVVLPALLADVERRLARGETVSGRDLISAVAVGVDLAGGLGDVTTTALRFFRPGTAGIFGGVAAVANARRMDSARIADAFGIAYGDLSGTMQPHTEGSTMLPVQMGFNARGALTAIDLAAAGHTGPREVFEGSFGYFSLIETAGEPEVGWRVAAHMRTAMVLDALEMARWQRGTNLDGLVAHSGAGSQLRFKEWSQHRLVVVIVGVRRGPLRGAPFEGLPGPAVEGCGDSVEVDPGVLGQVGALGKVLA